MTDSRTTNRMRRRLIGGGAALIGADAGSTSIELPADGVQLKCLLGQNGEADEGGVQGAHRRRRHSPHVDYLAKTYGTEQP